VQTIIHARDGVKKELPLVSAEALSAKKCHDGGTVRGRERPDTRRRAYRADPGTRNAWQRGRRDEPPQRQTAPDRGAAVRGKHGTN